METDRLIVFVGIALQLVGWLSLWPTKFCERPLLIAGGKALLVASLLALGCLTLVAAALQNTCALMTGGTSTVLVLIVILLGAHEPTGEADPNGLSASNAY